MAKEINNTLIDYNMDDVMRNQTGQKQVWHEQQQIVPAVKPRKGRKPAVPYRHCSFICAINIWDEILEIVDESHLTIRQVMELILQKGIKEYRAKHKKGNYRDDIF